MGGAAAKETQQKQKARTPLHFFESGLEDQISRGEIRREDFFKKAQYNKNEDCGFKAARSPKDPESSFQFFGSSKEEQIVR